jgi:hypothetical protein
MHDTNCQHLLRSELCARAAQARQEDSCPTPRIRSCVG